ncbi:organic cation/carnitine transporter 2-like isoform X2 [Syngnathoides biaculeatus]|uniref:organic cation/carnitine transporter 2-like isoform X2 n=1 Tax=Syngnathoides biaculeatus TaxID=300417 RepID=UPI002ADD3874|nr:organic cation/carnitine transporter 2-like isoform X2 [Syngnathoides biaculeatus]
MDGVNDYEADTAFLGDWGPFQRRLSLLLCITMIPNGYGSLVVVFLADTPAHRCLVPAGVPNLTEEWRNASIPLEEDGRPAECSRYRLDTLRGYSKAGLLPSEVNLTGVPREGCLDGWEYDRSVYTSTIVSEWDLVCSQQWKQPLTSSIYFCGYLVGSFLSGQLSDRFGRKIVLFVTLASQTLCGFIQVFSQSWIAFCVLYFLGGISHISNYLSAYVLGAEIVSPPVREFFTTAGSCVFFALGYMLLPLHAYFLRDWRMLLLGITTPGFLLLTFWWFIPESPRWLLSQGRIAEAEAILKEAAKTNKIEAPEKIFTPLQKECGSEKMKAYNICDILRLRNIGWMSAVLWLVWSKRNSTVKEHDRHRLPGPVAQHVQPARRRLLQLFPVGGRGGPRLLHHVAHVPPLPPPSHHGRQSLRFGFLSPGHPARSGRPALAGGGPGDDRKIQLDGGVRARLRLHRRALPDCAEEHGLRRLLHGLQDWQHPRTLHHLPENVFGIPALHPDGRPDHNGGVTQPPAARELWNAPAGKRRSNAALPRVLQEESLQMRTHK